MFGQDDSAGAGSVNGVFHYHDKVIVVNTERERVSAGFAELETHLSALKPRTHLSSRVLTVL